MSVPENPRERFYFVVPIPLDKEGHGPCEIEEAIKVDYEVWNQLFETKGSHEFLPDAIQQCEELNREFHK